MGISGEDTPPSQLRTAVLSHRCKPLLLWLQSLMCDIPTLSQCRLFPRHCHSATRPIKSTPVNLITGRPSRPSISDHNNDLPHSESLLLWSEMRGLRTSVNQIRIIDPHLADDKLAAANRHLETLTLTLSLGKAETITLIGWTYLVMSESWYDKRSFWMIGRSLFRICSTSPAEL
jgi:hypothetical protein